MTIRIGVVMDALSSIHYEKDSTLAMLWEAKARGWQIIYFEPQDLFLKNTEPLGDGKYIDVFQNSNNWFQIKHEKKGMSLAELDVILMRKDPPFDQNYIYLTYLLEHAEKKGVLVVNRPQSLRDANEKLFVSFFPDCAPPTLVTRSIHQLKNFWQEQADIVCKPLDVMGGQSVFRLREHDVNASAIFEALTCSGTTFVMAQRFIADIVKGDKRILLIDGKPLTHALARVPQGDDWRGNLALGAKAVVQPLTLQDQFICRQVGPSLRSRGLYFVGIDVIGDYLTEINVTSPTGIRQLDEALNINISAMLFDCIQEKLKLM